jgi:hypothetical protein
MIMTEKVRLVDQQRKEHGLNRCLRATGHVKSTYQYRKRCPDAPSEDDERLITHIREITRPFELQEVLRRVSPYPSRTPGAQWRDRRP